MKKLVFYRCRHCGNIAVKLVDSKVPMVCCGEPMQILNANTTDAALEKHVPEVTINGNHVDVVIGSTIHPMLPEHYIQFIVLKTSLGYSVRELNPGEEPKAHFELSAGETIEEVYEYCNLHGLWVK